MMTAGRTGGYDGYDTYEEWTRAQWHNGQILWIGKPPRGWRKRVRETDPVLRMHRGWHEVPSLEEARPRARERVQMGTFRNWLQLQEVRNDEVGWGARWWTNVTPGKISSPTGIIRKLEEFRDEPGITPDQKANHERAIAGIRAGHLQWRDGGASSAPLEAAPPLAVAPHPVNPDIQDQLPFQSPEGRPQPPLMPVSQLAPQPQFVQPPPDPAVAAIDRLTDAIMVLIRQNDAILTLAGLSMDREGTHEVTEPTQAEWAWMYSMADHQPEG